LLPARLRTFVDFCADFFRGPARPINVPARPASQDAIRVVQRKNLDEDLATM
jgi:hypothetical protein